MTPHWLMPVIHCQSSSGMSPTAPLTPTPALLTSRSTSPSQAVASACRRFMSSIFETSQRTARAEPPRCSTRRTVSARPASSTSASTRRADRPASSRDTARPRPPAAPVTTHEGRAGSMLLHDLGVLDGVELGELPVEVRVALRLDETLVRRLAVPAVDLVGDVHAGDDLAERREALPVEA